MFVFVSRASGVCAGWLTYDRESCLDEEWLLGMQAAPLLLVLRYPSFVQSDILPPAALQTIIGSRSVGQQSPC